ncbi:MAG: SGNH/GDSL hydrolase family protein, partial [Planctomycetes bacterium]|nr:SGNH/GDSL hydrolase family protein [Planctomycetota bacterium]
MIFFKSFRMGIIRILLVFAALALALACVELFLRVFDPFHYDEAEAMESFSQAIFCSEGGELKLRPNVRSHYLGKQVTINSHGMRNPETSIEKPDGIYRILVIGNSIPFGWGVGDEDPFPRRIEQMLNHGGQDGEHRRFEIVNSAVPGWGLLEEYHFLIQKGFDYQPDLILLMVIYNDFPSYLDPAVPRVFFPESILKPRVGRLLWNSALFLLTGRSTSDYDPRSRLRPEGIRPICAALERFHQVCRQAGTPVVLLDGICHESIRECCMRIGFDRIGLDLSWDH